MQRQNADDICAKLYFSPSRSEVAQHIVTKYRMSVDVSAGNVGAVYFNPTFALMTATTSGFPITPARIQPKGVNFEDPSKQIPSPVFYGTTTPTGNMTTGLGATKADPMVGKFEYDLTTTLMPTGLGRFLGGKIKVIHNTTELNKGSQIVALLGTPGTVKWDPAFGVGTTVLNYETAIAARCSSLDKMGFDYTAAIPPTPDHCKWFEYRPTYGQAVHDQPDTSAVAIGMNGEGLFPTSLFGHAEHGFRAVIVKPAATGATNFTFELEFHHQVYMHDAEAPDTADVSRVSAATSNPQLITASPISGAISEAVTSMIQHKLRQGASPRVNTTFNPGSLGSLVSALGGTVKNTAKEVVKGHLGDAVKDFAVGGLSAVAAGFGLASEAPMGIPMGIPL